MSNLPALADAIRKLWDTEYSHNTHPQAFCNALCQVTGEMISEHAPANAKPEICGEAAAVVFGAAGLSPPTDISGDGYSLDRGDGYSLGSRP